MPKTTLRTRKATYDITACHTILPGLVVAHMTPHSCHPFYTPLPLLRPSRTRDAPTTVAVLVVAGDSLTRLMLLTLAAATGARQVSTKRFASDLFLACGDSLPLMHYRNDLLDTRLEEFPSVHCVEPDHGSTRCTPFAGDAMNSFGTSNHRLRQTDRQRPSSSSPRAINVFFRELWILLFSGGGAGGIWPCQFVLNGVVARR